MQQILILTFFALAASAIANRNPELEVHAISTTNNNTQVFTFRNMCMMTSPFGIIFGILGKTNYRVFFGRGKLLGETVLIRHTKNGEVNVRHSGHFLKLFEEGSSKMNIIQNISMQKGGNERAKIPERNISLPINVIAIKHQDFKNKEKAYMTCQIEAYSLLQKSIVQGAEMVQNAKANNDLKTWESNCDYHLMSAKIHSLAWEMQSLNLEMELDLEQLHFSNFDSLKYVFLKEVLEERKKEVDAILDYANYLENLNPKLSFMLRDVVGWSKISKELLKFVERLERQNEPRNKIDRD